MPSNTVAAQSTVAPQVTVAPPVAVAPQITVAPQSGATGPYHVFDATHTGAFSLAVDPVLFSSTTASFSVQNALFQLVLNPAQAGPAHPLMGAFAVQAGIWTFDGSDLRATVRTAFDDILNQIEAQEGKGLIAGASTIVRAALAVGLPATFAESLYFSYGLVRQASPSAQTYVDITPGMRLRVESQVSQFVAPAGTQGGTPNSPLSNGFVPGSQAVYNVVELAGPSGTTQVGIDAFLAGATVPVVAPNQGGAGGVIDLQSPSLRGRHLRLCYPTTMPSSDSVGSADPRQNVALIWANDLATLALSTAAYYQGTSAGALFFRGRTVAVPEIACLVNGAPIHVPVGTTVRQVLQQRGALPRVPGAISAGLEVTRLAPALGDLRDCAFRVTPAQITFTAGTASLPHPYDVPVLAGDSITLGS